MKKRNPQRFSGTSCRVGPVAMLLVGAIGADAQACAVCYGDPDSALVKGTLWGMVLLFGVIGTVLTGIASLAVFWTVRARRLSASGLTASGLTASGVSSLTEEV